MDSSVRNAKTLHCPVSSDVKQTTSGYAQSNAETELPESEWTVDDEIKKDLQDDEELESVGNHSSKSRRYRHQPDATLPLRTYTSKRDSTTRHELNATLPLRTSLPRTRHSKSPHSLRHREQKTDSGVISHGNAKGEYYNHRHHLSPYKPEKEGDQDQPFSEKEFASSLRRQKYVKNNDSKVASHRSSSAPKPRLKEKESYQYEDDGKKKDEKTAEIHGVPTSLRSRDVSRTRIENDASHKHNSYLSGEINEMIANAKISRGSTVNVSNYGTIDSIAPDDLFFTQDYASIGTENKYGNQRPYITTQRNPATHRQQHDEINSSFRHNGHNISASSDAVSSHKTKTKYSSSGLNRQPHHSINEFGSRTTADSNRKLITNRQKIQEETCFPCIRNGYCVDSRKSPEKGRALYEATIIEKTFVVENVRQFWADKHQPAALSGFTCQKEKALLLKTLASIGIFPHILFKGPPGSGKKALTMALLREIFGPSVWNVCPTQSRFSNPF